MLCHKAIEPGYELKGLSRFKTFTCVNKIVSITKVIKSITYVVDIRLFYDFNVILFMFDNHHHHLTG